MAGKTTKATASKPVSADSVTQSAPAATSSDAQAVASAPADSVTQSAPAAASSDAQAVASAPADSVTQSPPAAASSDAQAVASALADSVTQSEPSDATLGHSLLPVALGGLLNPTSFGVDLAGQWSLYGQICPAAIDVLKERVRQVECEGCDPERDDAFTDYQLPRAAVSYGIMAAGLPSHRATLYWPFSPVDFKATGRRRSLVKAAALLLAEIERLDRAEAAAD